MLDLKYIQKNPDEVKQMLEKRGQKDLLDIVDQILKLDRERRDLIQDTETKKQQRNEASQKIATLKKSKGDAGPIMAEMKKVSQEIKEGDEKLSAIDIQLGDRCLQIPNLVDASIPEGKSEADNKEIKKWGDLPKFTFKPKTHDEIGEKLGILDFKKAGQVTGARFVFLKGLAARLEHALIQFMLKHHIQRGYEEILPPFIVHQRSLIGTGQLPKFKEDQFKIENWEYYLVPTAEVPLTNYHREEILEQKDLPKKYVAYTPCFRAEAGSYGKDTKGLKRQHQFNKVELVKFSTPEQSAAELESLLADAESILQALKLPYRVITLCTADIGFSAAKTYDIEVWCPGADQYMEISSCSVFTDFQARRAKIRYRDKASNKVQFLHTINGSGLAIGRTMIALMENTQKEDGSFEIPEVLKPWL